MKHQQLRLQLITFLACLVNVLAIAPSIAEPIYDAGVAPRATDPANGVILGTVLLRTDPAHPSVPGLEPGGTFNGGISASGNRLDTARTYIWDLAAQGDLTDGVANRGDLDFAMLIWDMGARFDGVRLYTHQDHYLGGPVTTAFIAQDLMEYSVWGSNDGDAFVLLSDVIGFDINGGGAGLPTYTFSGVEPTVVYRGGSTEFGIVNAYTREYVFPNAYRYFGIRTSQISLDARDADPELDGFGAFNIASRPPGTPGTNPGPGAVPEPASSALLSLGLLSLLACACYRRKQTKSLGISA